MKKAKRFIIVLLSVIMLFGCFASVEASSSMIRISKTHTELLVGEHTYLKITGAVCKVKWKSSNKKVATVEAKSEYGIVTAKSEGTTVITATIGNQVLKCIVKVYKYYIPSSDQYKQINPWYWAGEYLDSNRKHRYSVNFYTDTSDYSTGVIYVNYKANGKPYCTERLQFVRIGNNVYRIKGTKNYVVFGRDGATTYLKYYKNGKLVYTGWKAKSYSQA